MRPSVSRALIIASDGDIGLSGMDPVPSGRHHAIRWKLVSFSQVSSTFIIRFPWSRICSKERAYCWRSTKQRSEFALGCTFRIRWYLSFISLFMTCLTNLEPIDMLNSSAILSCSNLELGIRASFSSIWLAADLTTYIFCSRSFSLSLRSRSFSGSFCDMQTSFETRYRVILYFLAVSS